MERDDSARCDVLSTSLSSSLAPSAAPVASEHAANISADTEMEDANPIAAVETTTLDDANHVAVSAKARSSEDNPSETELTLINTADDGADIASDADADADADDAGIRSGRRPTQRTNGSQTEWDSDGNSDSDSERSDMSAEESGDDSASFSRAATDEETPDGAQTELSCSANGNGCHNDEPLSVLLCKPSCSVDSAAVGSEMSSNDLTDLTPPTAVSSPQIDTTLSPPASHSRSDTSLTQTTPTTCRPSPAVLDSSWSLNDEAELNSTQPMTTDDAFDLPPHESDDESNEDAKSSKTADSRHSSNHSEISADDAVSTVSHASSALLSLYLQAESPSPTATKEALSDGAATTNNRSDELALVPQLRCQIDTLRSIVSERESECAQLQTRVRQTQATEDCIRTLHSECQIIHDALTQDNHRLHIASQQAATMYEAKCAEVNDAVDMRSRADRQIECEQEEVRHLILNNQQLQTQCAALTESNDRLNAINQEQREQMNMMRSDMDGLCAKLNQTQSEAESLHNHSSCHTRITALSTEQTEHISTIDQLRADCVSLRIERSQLKDERDSALRKFAECEGRLNAISADLQQQREHISILRTEKEAHIRSAAEANVTITMLKSREASNENTIERLRETGNQHLIDVTRIQVQHNQLQTELSAIRSEYTQARADLTHQLSLMTSEGDRLRSDLSEMKKRGKELEVSLNNRLSTANDLAKKSHEEVYFQQQRERELTKHNKDALAEIQRLIKSGKDIEAENAQLEANIKSISDDRDSAVEAKNAFARQLRNQIAELQQQVQTKDDKIDRLNARLRGKGGDTDDDTDDDDDDDDENATGFNGKFKGYGGVIMPSIRPSRKHSDVGCTNVTAQTITIKSASASPRNSTSSVARNEESSVFDSPFVSSLMAAEAMTALRSPAFIVKKGKDDDPFDIPSSAVASPHILFSGVKSEAELTRLSKITSALGGLVQTKYSDEVTHCVCPPNTFTQKTIICSANDNVWIIEPPWLTECQKAGRWIDEAPFGKRFPQPQYANSRIFISNPEAFPPRGKLELLRQVMRVLSCVEITQFLPDVDLIVTADVAAAKLAFASFPHERIVSVEMLLYRLPFYLTKPPKTTAERKTHDDQAANVKRPADEIRSESTTSAERPPITPVIASSKRLREATNDETQENGAVITPKRSRRIQEIDGEESKQDAVDEQEVAKPTRRLRSQDKHNFIRRRDY